MAVNTLTGRPIPDRDHIPGGYPLTDDERHVALRALATAYESGRFDNDTRLAIAKACSALDRLGQLPRWIGRPDPKGTRMLLAIFGASTGDGELIEAVIAGAEDRAEAGHIRDALDGGGSPGLDEAVRWLCGLCGVRRG